MPWFRSYISCLTGLTIVVVLAALLVLSLPREGCTAPLRYWRSEATYTIRAGGDSYDVARVLNKAYDCRLSSGGVWLLGQEIARMNGIPANAYLRAGTPPCPVLRVPVYRRVKCYRATCRFDSRNWHVAQQYSRGVIPDSGPLMAVGTIRRQAGKRYYTSEALLVAIRCKENCETRRDAYALGFKCPGVWNTNIRTQYHAAACLIGAWQLQHGQAPTHTQASIRRLSYRYCEGSRTWARDIWSYYQKARGR